MTLLNVLIIILVVLVVALGVLYYFGRKAQKKQAEQMEQMEAALPQVRENMKNLKQKQADIIAKYPSDIKTEKVIWILQDIEDHNDYHISDITFTMSNPLQITPDVSDTTDTRDDSSTDTATNNVPAVTGYYASIGVKYDATYEGLKDMLAYVNEYSDRITITDFSSSVDSETGRLTGEMTFSMYVITNTGKDYVEPKFDMMLKGVQNIFGNNAGTASGTN